jgi:hypothetical protein
LKYFSSQAFISSLAKIISFWAKVFLENADKRYVSSNHPGETP